MDRYLAKLDLHDQLNSPERYRPLLLRRKRKVVLPTIMIVNSLLT